MSEEPETPNPIPLELVRDLRQACTAILSWADAANMGRPQETKPEEPITLESLCPPVIITKLTLLDTLMVPTKHTVLALERHGFYTVGSILKLSKAEALSIPRVGHKSLDELLAVIQAHGFRLRGVPRSKH
jgi:DNA-directed RNA polymerase alpha subunit